MKALILNSGMGTRMGVLTSEQPKCMTEISARETILSRQLRLIAEAGITEVVMTTGYYDNLLEEYCRSLDYPLHFTFVKNEDYRNTNYIYSIYSARKYLEDSDILLMHGDLVFEYKVLADMLGFWGSCMKVSSTAPLPDKDFKAVIREGKIEKIGVHFFENALEAQPLYKWNREDWKVWLKAILEFCERGQTKCYAEEAFNALEGRCCLYPLDTGNDLCTEVDTEEDLIVVKRKVKEVENRMVYMCCSTDVVHSGHIAMIHQASRLGKLVIGVLSDEAVASYKRFPLVPANERKSLFEHIKGVDRVVEQKELSYARILRSLKPSFVVHGDDWVSGFQKPIRDEVVNVLSEYGGRLVEFPYSRGKKYEEIEQSMIKQIAMPDQRRGRLRRLLEIKGCITAIEAHSGITGLLAEKTAVMKEGKVSQFDAMWVSSLCDSTAKGKPDIELVDMTSRFRTIDDIMEVTTKPVIFDGDTGGLTEHFVYTVRSLERLGVSMVIIEDKTGLKKNSLFGTEVAQTQDTIVNFCDKIRAGKKAQKTADFMICARIESLILEKGMEDALNRAFAYVQAGADAIMIHSRKKEADEIFAFLHAFRMKDRVTPVVLVPTSYHSVHEQEFKDAGANVIIYANQLTRSGFPAMKRAAELILEHHRAKECDEICMPFKEIISLIPEE